MTSDSPSSEVLRVRAIVESDPGAVIRVLHHFQARNITPRRISAQCVGPDYVQVEVDVAGLSRAALERIAAKIRSAATAICATVCD
jgi:hypothetical protein